MLRFPAPFVFILGPPGCGKGTQCSLLSEEFSLLHLSAGELLRQYIQTGSDESQRLSKIMNEGQIVPAEVTVGLLQEQLNRTKAPLCMIDGFPRNLENYTSWNKIVVRQPQFVLNITAHQRDVQARLLNRPGGRSDDNLETIKKRFKVYESMRPVLEAYQAQDKLRTVDGSSSISEVYKQVREVFVKELGDTLVLTDGLQTCQARD